MHDKSVLAAFNLFSLWPIQFVVSRNRFYLMTEKLLLFLLRYYQFVKRMLGFLTKNTSS